MYRARRRARRMQHRADTAGVEPRQNLSADLARTGVRRAARLPVRRPRWLIRNDVDQLGGSHGPRGERRRGRLAFLARRCCIRRGDGRRGGLDVAPIALPVFAVEKRTYWVRSTSVASVARVAGS